jgi:signal transduction histidine kinase
LPFSLAIAVMGYRLWDIDLVINRALVYGSLTAFVVGVYVVVVALLGVLVRGDDGSNNLLISLFATAAIAILFQPLRERVQRTVNRLTYGERDEPYAVLTRLGQRLESTLAPAAVLPLIVETVAQALQVPYVAIDLRNEAAGRRTEWGQLRPPSAALFTFPLLYQNEMLGTLSVAPRTGEEKFSAADLRLLNDLARQAGVAAHSVQLTTDLQRLTAELQHSRERLVTAREEERRRLRRDLHDGLGPTLAALALNASTVRDLIGSDSNTATQMASELQIEIRAAVTEIRRLVYALRPPTLDGLGLVAAIRELANQSTGYLRSSNPGNQLSITVDAPDTLPPLPAAVEVAAYRIAQEALTNVVRHAHARSCSIRLALDGTADSQLKLEIRDNGIGLPEEQRAGVGLHSMRERAEELGGTFVVESQKGKATRVVAHLPIARAE